MNGPELRLVAEGLLALGREEHRLISEGKLLELNDLVGRRQTLLEQWNSCFDPKVPAPPDLQALLEQIRAEGRQNMALLQGLRDDLGRQLSQTVETSRAVAGYSGVKGY